MDAITLVATVDEDRRLTLELPAGTPIGPVEVVIRPLPGSEVRPSTGPEPAAVPLTREAAREKLRAAGKLAEGPFAPPDAVPLSPEEEEELGRLFASPQPISELIDEDRGPR